MKRRLVAGSAAVNYPTPNARPPPVRQWRDVMRLKYHNRQALLGGGASFGCVSSRSVTFSVVPAPSRAAARLEEDRRDFPGKRGDDVQAKAIIDAGTMWQASNRPITIRIATIADVGDMNILIERSARELNDGHYTPDQLSAAIDYVFGVDTQLIEDGSYFVAEREGSIAGCGGWSGRRTLFGGDRFSGREDARVDPATDAARIRAFFVAPDHARAGVGAALLAASEAAARDAGFRTLELMATLPGVAFYQVAGFVAGEPVRYRAGNVDVPFVPMTKKLSDPTGTIRRPASPQADQRLGRAMS